MGKLFKKSVKMQKLLFRLQQTTVTPLLDTKNVGLLSFKRFRHNINPTRPKMPTWRRKIMLEFAEPKFSDKHPTTEKLWQDCPRHLENLEKSNEPNAWEAIYVRELLELANSSKMIGFYHFNYTESRQARKAWQNGKRLKMELKTYEHVMVKGALKGTKWENLLFFLDGSIGHPCMGAPSSRKNVQRIAFCSEFLPKNLLQLE